VGEDAAGEFVGHLVERGRTKIVRRDERKDGRTGIGGAVQVANVNFVERGFADAEHQRAFFFEANVGGALDQMRRDAIGNASQRAHAAGQDDHGVAGIGTAGDVGADIGVGLLANFAGLTPEQLLDHVVAAAEFEFFSHDAQGAVRGDKVDGCDARIALDGKQQAAHEDCAAGAGGGDAQVLRWMRHSF